MARPRFDRTTHQTSAGAASSAAPTTQGNGNNLQTQKESFIFH